MRSLEESSSWRQDVDGGVRGQGGGNMVSWGQSVSVGRWKVLEMDGGDSGTTVLVCFMPLGCAPETG